MVSNRCWPSLARSWGIHHCCCWTNRRRASRRWLCVTSSDKSPGSGSRNLTVLLSEQNVRFAEALCDRVYIIDKGSIQFAGTFVELRKDPDLRQRYLALGEHRELTEPKSGPTHHPILRLSHPVRNGGRSRPVDPVDGLDGQRSAGRRLSTRAGAALATHLTGFDLSTAVQFGGPDKRLSSKPDIGPWHIGRRSVAAGVVGGGRRLPLCKKLHR